MKRVVASVRLVVVLAAVVAGLLGGGAASLLGTCGPFTDVAADAFCPFVLEIFYLGITAGTTATTYDPSANVTRLQMSAFLSRTVDATLKRGSRRAIMNQLWTATTPFLGATTVGVSPGLLEFDGADLWVPNYGGTVSRVRASDGRLVETWTGANFAWGVAVGGNRILVTGNGSPGSLYMIDPSQPPGSVTTVASNLGVDPAGIAFDGARVWTANGGPPASVSIVTPGASIPWTVTTVTVGALNIGALYDGSNVWITDQNSGTLLKLDGSGAVLQTVTVGSGPIQPVFDGGNIWVPNDFSNSVTVVRASNGVVLQTLTGSGLNEPSGAGFDGERVMITNYGGPGNSVSVWKAADLTFLGTFPAASGSRPFGVCSDGVHFWVTEYAAGKLVRF